MVKPIHVQGYDARLRKLIRHVRPGSFGRFAEEGIPRRIPWCQRQIGADEVVTVVLQHSRGIDRPRLLREAHWGP